MNENMDQILSKIMEQTMQDYPLKDDYNISKIYEECFVAHLAH